MITKGWASRAWGGFKYATAQTCNGIVTTGATIGGAVGAVFHAAAHPIESKKKAAKVYEIYSKAVAVVDKTDAVQKIAHLDGRVKSSYHCVQPKAVFNFNQRFGIDAMLDIASFAKLASTTAKGEIAHIGGVKGAALSGVIGAAKYIVDVDLTLDVHVKTAALGAMTWAGDKMQSTLPNGDAEARSRFAAGITRDLQKVVSEVEKAASKAREHTGGNWGSTGFIHAFNAELQECSIAKGQIGKNTFYKKLAMRLLERLEGDLPNSLELHQADFMKETLAYLSPETKRDNLAALLMNIHNQITDPLSIKQWLTSILDASSEGLDRKFADYMKQLEPGAIDYTPPPIYDRAYGQTVMALLQAIQPNAFRLNIMGLYGRFHDKKMPEGQDFLSLILRDATGSSIESMMTGSTDTWLKSALKMARLNLLNLDDNLVAHPSYISEDDWNALSSEEKIQANDLKSPLGKELKDRHIARVDAAFLKSSHAMAKSVLCAGLVVEQWLPTIKQMASDPKRCRLTRVLTFVVGHVLAMSGVKFLLDLLHRANIYLRMAIASLASIRAGHSISSRVDELLRTRALDIMTMHMMEKAMERLDLLDKSAESAALPKIALMPKAAHFDAAHFDAALQTVPSGTTIHPRQDIASLFTPVAPIGSAKTEIALEAMSKLLAPFRLT